jgi:Snapin/Pallidin
MSQEGESPAPGAPVASPLPLTLEGGAEQMRSVLAPESGAIARALEGVLEPTLEQVLGHLRDLEMTQRELADAVARERGTLEVERIPGWRDAQATFAEVPVYRVKAEALRKVMRELATNAARVHRAAAALRLKADAVAADAERRRQASAARDAHLARAAAEAAAAGRSGE